MLENLIFPAYLFAILSYVGVIVCVYFLVTRIDASVRAPYQSEDGKRVLRRLAIFWTMGLTACAAYCAAVRTEPALLVALLAAMTIVFAGGALVLRFEYRVLTTRTESDRERNVGLVYLAIALVGYAVVYLGEIWELREDVRTSTAVQPMLFALMAWLIALHQLSLAHRSAVRRGAPSASRLRSGT